jgi:hypothetical protein
VEQLKTHVIDDNTRAQWHDAATKLEAAAEMLRAMATAPKGPDPVDMVMALYGRAIQYEGQIAKLKAEIEALKNPPVAAE